MSFDSLVLLAKSGRRSLGTSSSTDEKLARSMPLLNKSLSSSLLDDDKLLSDDYLNWSRSRRDQEDEFVHLEHFEDFATKVKASIKADEEQKKGKMKPLRTILDDPEFLEEYPKPPPPKPKIAAKREDPAPSGKESVKRRLFINGDGDEDDEEVAVKTTPTLRSSDEASELERLRRENEALREENAKLRCVLMDNEVYKFGLKSLSAVIREMHTKLSDKSRSKEDIDTPFSLLDFANERNEKSDESATNDVLTLDVTRKMFGNGSTKESLPGGFTKLKMKNGDSYMDFPSGKKVFVDSQGTKITETETGAKEISNQRTGQYECYTKGMLHEAYFGDTSYVAEKKDEFCVSVKSLEYPLVTIESPDGSTILVQPNGNVTLVNK